MLSIGVNPFGIAYTIGIVGAGTPRVNPQPLGVEGFISLAEEHSLKGVEVTPRMLAPLDDAGLERIRERLASHGMWVVLGEGPPLPTDIAPLLPLAKKIGAKTIRLALTTVLCGDRAARWDFWNESLASVRRDLLKAARLAADAGLSLALENHQDFGSAELLELCELAGPNVGVCLDCGNPLAVGEDPVEFAKAVLPRLKHVHLKDYRAQFTPEGYRLVRCAVGDGAVDFAKIAEIVGKDRVQTASLEPGWLEVRHVRLLCESWWRGYDAALKTNRARVLEIVRRNALPADADHRTPWERGESSGVIVEYEMAEFRKSVENMRKLFPKTSGER
ncbi:MAG TPA: sugar phosphate isomerase/epimerase [Planctomycetota bacterium]|nr:sugar phosphate isomerase/epimerase [Planctomycetota bacterium]